jgi:phosphate transport system substrate-binding protein
MLARRFLLAGLIAGTLCISTSCGRHEPRNATRGDPAGGVVLRGAGATFPAPLYKRWFTEYEKSHAGVAIHYDPVGSGQGVKRFVGRSSDLTETDLVDFAASDAAMQDAEIAQVARGVQLVPMTSGAVVLAYNLPGFAGQLRLSRAALAGIFLGKITLWNDPELVKENPGLKENLLSITRVVRLDSSGTTFAFTNHLSAISDEWRDRFGPVSLADWPGLSMTIAGNEAVAARVERSPGAIGYVQSGFAERVGLKVAALENKAGQFTLPGKENVMAALASARLPENLRLFVPDPEGKNSYPVVTLSWVLVYREYPDARKAAAIRELLNWCLTSGQAASSDLGYIPLSSGVVAAAKAALESIGVAPAGN